MGVELSAVALVVVSVVLALAGVSKIRDTSRTMISFQALGLPDAAVPPLAFAVPIVELVLAVALWIPAWRVPAAVAAALLFAAFTGVVANTLRQGRRVHCGCFGDLGRSEITGWTLVRNVALVAAAILVAAVPPAAGPIAEALTRDGVTIALTAVIAALAVALVVVLRLTLDLLRRYGDALEKLEPTPATIAKLVRGDEVRDVPLAEIDGPPVRLASLWADRPALVLYADPACSACKLVVPEVVAWARAHPEVTTAVVSPRSWRRAAQEHADAPVRWLLDRDLDAFGALSPPRTPSAFLVDVDGTMRDDVAVGNLAIRSMLGLAAARPLPEVAVVAAGRDADEVTSTTVGDLLPDGGDVVLWNPRCGFCTRLADELADVEPADAAAVLFVSTAPLEAPWTLPWPVVVDQTGGVLHAARAPGTPSLVTVAADGAVGPPLVGSDEVAAHLRARTLVGAR